jgi:hypothetical protein
VPITRKFPRDNPGKVFPIRNENDDLQIAVATHDCKEAEYVFAPGVDAAAWFATADEEEKWYVRVLAFPVGLYGGHYGPDSVFECAAECVACDTLVFARFRWTNAVVFLPGGRRMGGRPVNRPDPMFDPEVTDLYNQHVAEQRLKAQQARKDAAEKHIWTPGR